MKFLLSIVLLVLILSVGLILGRFSPDMSDVEYRYASFTHRLLADLWDILFAFGIALPFWLIFDKWLHNLSFEIFVGGGSTPAISRVILGIVSLYNMTYLVGKSGQSWGRKREHLKVIDYAGNSIGFWKALVRNLIAGSVSSFFFLGFLWILWDKRRQAWHDKVMKTFVVYEEEGDRMLEHRPHHSFSPRTQIYVSKNEKQLGPYTPAEVRSRITWGQFTEADSGWYEGLPGWLPLSQLLASFPIELEALPPVPRKSSGSAQASFIIAIVAFVARFIVTHVGIAGIISGETAGIFLSHA